MKKSIGINAVINGAKTVLSLFFPLITYPYITRILQAEAIGQYNFSYSFINCFYILAALGIATYGIREGSRIRDDVNRLSEFVSEVYTINVLSTITSYILLVLFLTFFDKLKTYSSIIAVLSITMMFTTIGCEWVLTIYEEYFYITLRTISFLVFSTALMFLLVKNKEDVVVYAGILVLSNSGGNILNYFAARRKCKIKIMFNRNIARHIKPIIILSANNIATTIYVHSDILILGLYTSDYHTGIYTLSSKIYSIIKQVLSAMIIVSIPRFSWLLGKNDTEGYQKLASRLINTFILLVFPCVVGLFALSGQIVLVISTNEFLPAIVPLRILSFALIFCIFTWFYTSCVLIPHNKEKAVLISTSVAASINVILNLFFIPVLGESAAAITTVIAEATSLCICLIYSKGLVRFMIYAKDIISIILGCIAIFFVCMLTIKFIKSSIISSVVSFFGSVTVYSIILLIFKNGSLLYALNFIKNIMFKKHSNFVSQ